jgi:hypothetical protein
MAKSSLCKIIFLNQSKVYEIYAKEIVQSNLMGFIEVSELEFSSKSSLLVDPSEEKLKSEFASVKRSYIPVYSIIRIDEVASKGSAKIVEMSEADKRVLNFPGNAFVADSKPKDD